MSSPNPLVAEQKKPERHTGAGIVDSGVSAWKDIFPEDGERDAFKLAMDGVSVGLDVLSMAMNPVGELVKAGVGWLMEQLDFLREPLEVLTGDPKHIEAIAETWNNVAAQLEAVAADYDGALSGTSGWGGDAATAYRATAAEYTAGLHAVAEQARTAAHGVTTAGIVVATARAIIFDIIATFISDVIARALLAAATSWCTLGGSLALFTASIVAEAVNVLAKIQKKISKLLGAIQRIVSKFGVLGDRSAEVASALGRKSSELGREANQALRASERMLAPQSNLAKRTVRRTEKWEDSTLNAVVGHDATRLGKETGKAAAENHEQYSGDAGRTSDAPRSGRISGSLDDDD